MDEPLDAGRGGGPGEARGALHADAALDLSVAAHGVHGGDGRVGAGQDRSREAGVGEVADLLRDAGDRWRRTGPTHDRSHARAPLGEGSTQAGPDEAVGTGDDDDHATSLARLRTWYSRPRSMDSGPPARCC